MQRSPLSIATASILIIMIGWAGAYLGMMTALKYSDTIWRDRGAPRRDQTADTLTAFIDSTTTSRSDTREEMTIMVGGDLMFDRGIRAIGDRNGYESLFGDDLVDLISHADIAIANLEGPITDRASLTLVNGKTTDSFTFTFSPESIRALGHAGIDVVSLANNHADNFGAEGYLETERRLRDASIEWFGNPWNSTSTRLTLRRTGGDTAMTTILERKGFKIALVGYHAFQSGIDRVLTEVRRVESPDTFTIVMPHWGQEYSATSSDIMRARAEVLTAAGADAIIGAHPHVIGEQSWIGATPVFYSVGNMLFDQYFSPQVKRGLIVELTIVHDKSGTRLDHLATHAIAIQPGRGVDLEK